MQASNDILRFIIGGYTKRQNDGLYLLSLDCKNDQFCLEKKLYTMAYPTYFTVDAQQKWLFCIDRGPNGKGGLSAFRLTNQALEKVSTQIDSEVPGCHIYYDETSHLLYVAQYHLAAMDVYAFENQSLHRVTSIKRVGSSIAKEQTHARPHALLSYKGHQILSDLGTDHLALYDERFKLQQEFKMPAGTGPRHLLLLPEYQKLYVIGELSNTVHVLRLDEEGRIAALEQTYPLVDKDAHGAHSAAIHVSPDHRFLYTSTRYCDYLNAFAINETGHLSFLQRISCKGKTPRDFCITRNGRFAIVPYLDSDEVSLYEREKDGTLIHRITQKVTHECARIMELC